MKPTAEVDYPHLYTEIPLQALSVEDSETLFGNLLNITDSPAQLRQMILEKTAVIHSLWKNSSARSSIPVR